MINQYSGQLKCWASVTGAGQYQFSPSQYFILRYQQDAGLQSVTLGHIQRGAKHDKVTQYWANVGSAT